MSDEHEVMSILCHDICIFAFRVFGMVDKYQDMKPENSIYPIFMSLMYGKNKRTAPAIPILFSTSITYPQKQLMKIIIYK